MRLVIIESPFRGAADEAPYGHVQYALACVRDCLSRGESPIASHLLLTRVLDDTGPLDRALGIKAGLAWGRVADATVVYTDRGISDGMRQGIEAAETAGRTVEYRTLPHASEFYPEATRSLR